jgi:hypothetical protein
MPDKNPKLDRNQVAEFANYLNSKGQDGNWFLKGYDKAIASGNTDKAFGVVSKAMSDFGYTMPAQPKKPLGERFNLERSMLDDPIAAQAGTATTTAASKDRPEGFVNTSIEAGKSLANIGVGVLQGVVDMVGMAAKGDAADPIQGAIKLGGEYLLENNKSEMLSKYSSAKAENSVRVDGIVKSVNDQLEKLKFNQTKISPFTEDGGLQLPNTAFVADAIGQVVPMLAPSMAMTRVGQVAKLVEAAKVAQAAGNVAKAEAIASRISSIQKGTGLVMGLLTQINSQIEEGQKQGLSRSDAELVGVTKSLITSYLDSAFGVENMVLGGKSVLSKVLKKESGKITKEIADDILKSGGLTFESFNKMVDVAGKSYASKIAKYVLGVGGASVKEAVDEGQIQGNVEGLIDMLYDQTFGKDRTVGQGRFGTDIFTEKYQIEKLNESAAGFLGGMAFSPMSVKTTDFKPVAAVQLTQSYLTGGEQAFQAQRSKMQSGIQSMLQAGQITQDEANNATKNLNDIATAIDTYKQNKQDGSPDLMISPKSIFQLYWTNESLNEAKSTQRSIDSNRQKFEATEQAVQQAEAQVSGLEQAFAQNPSDTNLIVSLQEAQDELSALKSDRDRGRLVVASDEKVASKVSRRVNFIEQARNEIFKNGGASIDLSAFSKGLQNIETFYEGQSVKVSPTAPSANVKGKTFNIKAISDNGQEITLDNDEVVLANDLSVNTTQPVTPQSSVVSPANPTTNPNPVVQQQQAEQEIPEIDEQPDVDLSSYTPEVAESLVGRRIMVKLDGTGEDFSVATINSFNPDTEEFSIRVDGRNSDIDYSAEEIFGYDTSFMGFVKNKPASSQAQPQSANQGQQAQPQASPSGQQVQSDVSSNDGINNETLEAIADKLTRGIRLSDEDNEVFSKKGKEINAIIERRFNDSIGKSRPQEASGESVGQSAQQKVQGEVVPSPSPKPAYSSLIYLDDLVGKTVSYMGKTGVVRQDEGGKITIENEDAVLEVSPEIAEAPIQSTWKYSDGRAIVPITDKKRHEVEFVNEDTVIVNGIEYDVLTKPSGTVVGLVVKDGSGQVIKNEAMLIAVEMERSRYDFEANNKELYDAIQEIVQDEDRIKQLGDAIANGTLSAEDVLNELSDLEKIALIEYVEQNYAIDESGVRPVQRVGQGQGSDLQGFGQDESTRNPSANAVSDEGSNSGAVQRAIGENSGDTGADVSPPSSNYEGLDDSRVGQRWNLRDVGKVEIVEDNGKTLLVRPLFGRNPQPMTVSDLDLTSRIWPRNVMERIEQLTPKELAEVIDLVKNWYEGFGYNGGSDKDRAIASFGFDTMSNLTDELNRMFGKDFVSESPTLRRAILAIQRKDGSRRRDFANIAQEIESDTGISVSPQDIGDFFLQYGTGSPDMFVREFGQAFKDIVGFSLNENTAKKILDKYVYNKPNVFTGETESLAPQELIDMVEGLFASMTPEEKIAGLAILDKYAEDTNEGAVFPNDRWLDAAVDGGDVDIFGDSPADKFFRAVSVLETQFSNSELGRSLGYGGSEDLGDFDSAYDGASGATNVRTFRPSPPSIQEIIADVMRQTQGVEIVPQSQTGSTMSVGEVVGASDVVQSESPTLSSVEATTTMPKEISDLYQEAATLRFTLGALSQQMGSKGLSGRAKTEYDNTKGRLDSIEVKLSEYEKAKEVTPTTKAEVKSEKKEQLFENGQAAIYYDDLYDESIKVKVLYKTGDGGDGTERYQVQFETGEERSIWSDKLKPESSSSDLEAGQGNPLRSVDATAEALSVEVANGLKFNANFNLPLEETRTPQQVAQNYHKAKADGSNPELVKAVEDLLGGEQSTEPEVEPNLLNQESDTSAWESAFEAAISNGDTAALSELYNKVQVALNGIAQKKGDKAVEYLNGLKKRLEDYAKTKKENGTNPTTGTNPRTTQSAGVSGGTSNNKVGRGQKPQPLQAGDSDRENAPRQGGNEKLAGRSSKRPSIVTAGTSLMPVIEPIIKVGEYDIDEVQLDGVNRALSAFSKGEKGFLLADGTGVGKTRQLIAIADREQRRTGGTVVIVTENQSIIESRFKVDAKNMGIDNPNIIYTTYSAISAEAKAISEKRTKLENAPLLGQNHSIVLFDEAHNLKNFGADKTTAARSMKFDRVVYATATPMDKPTGSAYFVAKLLNRSEASVYSELGYEIITETKRDKTGNLVETKTIRIKKGVSPANLIKNIVRVRNELISRGLMVRREYPFWGSFEETKITMPSKALEEEREIIGFYEELREVQANAAGQSVLERGRWVENRKVKQVVSIIKARIAEGKQVVVIAENVNTQTFKGLKKKQEEGSLRQIAELLKKEGISFSFSAGKDANVSGIDDFQSGKTQVILGNSARLSTGVDLDDQTGKKPRHLIMVTAPYSGNIFQQVMGRVSRRNTMTPSTVEMLLSDTEVDKAKAKVVRNKLAVLRSVQDGTIDADTANLVIATFYEKESDSASAPSIEETPAPKRTTRPAQQSTPQSKPKANPVEQPSIEDVGDERMFLVKVDPTDAEFISFLKNINATYSPVTRRYALLGSKRDIVERAILVRKNRKQVDVWHGGPFDFDKFNLSRYLYKVSLHKGKSPDQYTWLEWDRPIDEGVKGGIIKKLLNKEDYQIKELSGRFYVLKDGESVTSGHSTKEKADDFVNLQIKRIASKIDNSTNGEQIYNVLSDILNSDKEASLFLLENGIDGIKYPAESIARGATSDTARGFNYVVFDENAITIEEKIRFQKEKASQDQKAEVLNGVLATLKQAFPNVEVEVISDAEMTEKFGAGMIGQADPVTGKISINGEKFRADTALHEFAHVYIGALRKYYPNLLREAQEKIKGTVYEAIAREHYAGDVVGLSKSVQEDYILEEALAMAIGDKGAKFDVKVPQQKSLLDTIKRIFKRIGDMLKKAFSKAIDTDAVVEDMTIEQIVKATAEKLLSGKLISNETYSQIMNVRASEQGGQIENIPIEQLERKQIIKGGAGQSKNEDTRSRLESIAKSNPDLFYTIPFRDGRMSHKMVKDEDATTTLDDMTKGGRLVPDDFYSNMNWYANLNEQEDRESARVIRQVRNNPDAEVTIYRGIPRDGVPVIGNGQWVSLSKLYAKNESEGDRVISKKVKASDVVWNADSINEFAYFPSDGAMADAEYVAEAYNLDKKNGKETELTRAVDKILSQSDDISQLPRAQKTLVDASPLTQLPQDTDMATLSNHLANNTYSAKHRTEARLDSTLEVDENEELVVRQMDGVALINEAKDAVQELVEKRKLPPPLPSNATFAEKAKWAKEVAKVKTLNALFDTFIMVGRDRVSILVLIGNLFFKQGQRGYDLLVTQTRRHYEKASEVKIMADNFAQQLSSVEAIRKAMHVFQGRTINRMGAETRTDIVKLAGISQITMDGQVYNSLELPDRVLMLLAMRTWRSYNTLDKDGNISKNVYTQIEIDNDPNLPDDRTGLQKGAPKREIIFDSEADVIALMEQAFDKMDSLKSLSAYWSNFVTNVVPYLRETYEATEFKQFVEEAAYFPLKTIFKGDKSEVGLNERDIRSLVSDMGILKAYKFDKKRHLDCSGDIFSEMSRYAYLVEKYVHFMPVVRNYENVYKVISPDMRAQGLEVIADRMKEAIEKFYKLSGYTEKPTDGERLYNALASRVATSLFALSPTQPLKQATTLMSLFMSQDQIDNKYILGRATKDYSRLWFNSLAAVTPIVKVEALDKFTGEAVRDRLVQEILDDPYAKNIVVRISQNLPIDVDLSLGNKATLTGSNFEFVDKFLSPAALYVGRQATRINEEFLLQSMKRPDVASVIVAYFAAKDQVFDPQNAKYNTLTDDQKGKEAARIASEAIRQTHQTYDDFDKTWSQMDNSAFMSKIVNLFASQSLKQLDRMSELFLKYYRTRSDADGKALALHATYVALLIPVWNSFAELGGAILRAMAADDEEKEEKIKKEWITRLKDGFGRNLLSTVPSVTGQVIEALIAWFNDKTYDDDVLETPTIATVHKFVASLGVLQRALDKKVEEMTEAQRVQNINTIWRNTTTAVSGFTSLSLGLSRDFVNGTMGQAKGLFLNEEEKALLEKVKKRKKVNAERKERLKSLRGN